MKNKSFLSVTLLLLCATTAALAAERSSLKCPDGGYTEKAAPPLITIGKTWRLIVCGTGDTTRDHGKKFILSGFALYPANPKGLIEKEIRVMSEIDKALVYQEKETLVVDEMFFYREDWVPAFRNIYSCNDQKCESSEEKCVFKRPHFKSKYTIKEVKEMITQANAGKNIDEIHIAAIKDLAVDGNLKARAYFSQPTKNLALDGASAEEFHADQRILERLKACK